MAFLNRNSVSKSLYFSKNLTEDGFGQFSVSMCIRSSSPNLFRAQMLNQKIHLIKCCSFRGKKERKKSGNIHTYVRTPMVILFFLFLFLFQGEEKIIYVPQWHNNKYLSPKESSNYDIQFQNSFFLNLIFTGVFLNFCISRMYNSIIAMFLQSICFMYRITKIVYVLSNILH